MIIAVDFDNTVVEHSVYEDLTIPLKLRAGAREALASLKRAGHILVLWSARNNRAAMYLPEFDPLIRAGIVGDATTDATRMLHADRWRQMVAFVDAELPGVFDAIDDGRQGKMEADMYIDDRAVQLGPNVTWRDIADLYGD